MTWDGRSATGGCGWHQHPRDPYEHCGEMLENDRRCTRGDLHEGPCCDGAWRPKDAPRLKTQTELRLERGEYPYIWKNK